MDDGFHNLVAYSSRPPIDFKNDAADKTETSCSFSPRWQIKWTARRKSNQGSAYDMAKSHILIRTVGLSAV
jgi:hypothetical protein